MTGFAFRCRFGYFPRGNPSAEGSLHAARPVPPVPVAVRRRRDRGVRLHRRLPPDRLRAGRGAEPLAARRHARRRAGERRSGRAADAVPGPPQGDRGRGLGPCARERAGRPRGPDPDALARRGRRRSRGSRVPLRAARDRGRRVRGDAPPEAADRHRSAPPARARAPGAHRLRRPDARDARRRRRRADPGPGCLPADRAEQHGGLQPAGLEGGGGGRARRAAPAHPSAERHAQLPHRVSRARGLHARVDERAHGGALPDRRGSAPRRPAPRLDAEDGHVDRTGPDVRQGSADAHDGGHLSRPGRLGRDRLLRQRQRRHRLERDAVRRAGARRHVAARAGAAPGRQGAGGYRRRAPRHPLAPGRGGLERSPLRRALRGQPRADGPAPASRDPRGPAGGIRPRRRRAGAVHRRHAVEGGRTSAATSASTASPSASSTPLSAP